MTEEGGGKKFLRNWAPAIGGLLVAGPFGALVGAGIGKYVSRNNQNSNNGSNLDYQDLGREIKKCEIIMQEAYAAIENYAKLFPDMYPNFDFSDFFLQNINDNQIKKDYFTFLKASIYTFWVDRAKDNDLSNEFPSQDNPIIDAFSWEDLPLFIETAYLSRLNNNREELMWVLETKERYPQKKHIRRDYFVMPVLINYLHIIASLESVVGRDIAHNYGAPNTSDPKYWEVKREVNDFYKLQETPKEIYSFVYGSENPYQELDQLIERFTSHAEQ